MGVIQSVLVGHHLAPGDNDGGTFIRNNDGSTRDFGSVKTANDYIKATRLNEVHGRHIDIWRVYLLTEVPV